ncbi:MAG: hypothetical protein ACLQBY_19065 [Solirubrobacteraceae bacterium]
MITTTRVPFTAKIAGCIALLACISLLATAATAGAAGTVPYQTETFAEYQQQLAGGQIRSAEINKRVGSVRVTLNDGRLLVAKFKRKEEKSVAAALTAKRVPVRLLTKAEAATEVVKGPKKTIHHRLRYIAGGALIVVLVIAGAVLFIVRKRKRASEE